MKTAGAMLCAVACWPAIALGASSHCSSDEARIFSCNTGTSVVSVCASKDLSARVGTLQYRFGPIGQPSLVFPEITARLEVVIRVGTLAFSGGGGAYIRFRRSQYAYVVYDALIKGSGERAGVAVIHAGRTIANLSCKGPAASALGPDFFAQAGLVTDEEDFEIP
jgi:hypothetical protein